MNRNHLVLILSRFKLSRLKQNPQKVYGGLLHTMWRIETTTGVYAIKQLSTDIDLKNKNIVDNYNLTEEIARRFIDKGISGISAIKASGQYLLISSGVGFLVYPCVDAKMLDRDAISLRHAIKIAEFLSKMHLINMEVPEILEPEFDIHDNDKIIALAHATQKSGIGFSELLNQRLTDLISINEIYRSSVLILKNHVIVSHGDLDQKNVLWDDSGNPLLIDWESAKKLNPTYEIVNAALDWSGITTHFDISIFIEMIKAYKAKGGIINKKIFESALHGVLGNWINWMAYNIHRAINGSTPEQKTLWVKQVNQTVETIFRLKAAIPELISFKLTI